MILYQIIVGRLPFEAPTAMGIVTKHLIEPPVPPSQIDGIQVSAAMEAVVLKAMSKDRNGRQPTALVLQQELNQVLSPKIALAQETPLGKDLFTDDTPEIKSTGVDQQVEVSPSPPPPEKRGSRAWLVIVILLIFVLTCGTFL